MIKQAFRKIVEDRFNQSGIKINGPNPWDLQVYNDQFYPRVIHQGSMGFGESYMDKWIDSEQLDETINRIFRGNLYKVGWLSPQKIWIGLMSRFFNKQSKNKAFEVGEKHYDLGNDLFECMLDKRMAYSCAYWKDAKNLDQAQEAKLDLICQKLELKPGSKVLDIGCGWGSFAKYAAEKYKVKVVGITISKQQVEFASQACKHLPVEIRFQDYRDVNEHFDSIVSIGQMEHVGHKNYQNYMKIVHRCLDQKGLFLLHTIGSNTTEFIAEPWIEKYIFPNGIVPSIKQLARAFENKFVMEDWHNFGPYYDQTLMAWFQNFNQHWNQLSQVYGERFYRMWKYYLLSCAGAFRARELQLWQIVFSKKGRSGVYQSIR